MKKTILFLAMISLSVPAVFAAEPLILEPLSPTVLSTTPGVGAQQPAANVQTPAAEQTNQNGPQISFPNQNGVYDATFTPRSHMENDPNMVPQNAAAEGKPVPDKGEPRVRVRTKQRGQGNSYWNAGGKGTKSFF